MNYELAKEVKDRGFPQDPSGIYAEQHPERWFDEEGLEPVTRFAGDGWTYIPTLSELIEACGEELYSLHRNGEKWTVHQKGTNFLEDDRFLSTNPEEAVARLWLALQTKTKPTD